MIKAVATSKVSGRKVEGLYTPYELLNNFIDSSDLVDDLSVCECQPIGESNVVDCSCHEEFEDFTLILEEVQE